MNPKVEFLYLSQEDVIRAGGLDIHGTMRAVETSFRMHAEGKTILPLKPVLRWGSEETEETTGRIMAMPAFLGGDLQIAGIKWIPSKPDNPVKRGLPRANAIIILNDPETLMPLAIMDGTIISAMRTGAASGVAAKYLANPTSQTLGMVGAGVQMRTQCMAFKAALPNLTRGRIYDVNSNKARAFAEEMSEQLGFEIQPASSAHEACKDADVFVTATMSSFAYVTGGFYKPGALHCEISFWDSHAQALAVIDRIFCDDYEQVANHGVDVSYRAIRDGIIQRDKIHNLGDVIIGKIPGRENNRQKILFNPIGLGIHDISEAYRVYQNASSRGIGMMLPLWEHPHWL